MAARNDPTLLSKLAHTTELAPVSGLFTPAPEGHDGGLLHLFPVRVYFEDTDLSGVTYHANYLRYMERARSDMLRLAGIDQRAAQESGDGAYAVTDLAIKYRAPAKLDDALVVISRVVAVRAASCSIAQQIVRGSQPLTEADVTAAFVSPDGRPKRQPTAWVERFRAIMAGRLPALPE